MARKQLPPKGPNGPEESPPSIDVETPGGAIARLPMGAILIKAENEALSAVALARPRDESRVLKGALLELDLLPEMAQKSYYSIPYKKRLPGGKVVIEKVEGPSIKS